MPAKLVTYNSQNYAGTLGSSLVTVYLIAAVWLELLLYSLWDHVTLCRN